MFQTWLVGIAIHDTPTMIQRLVGVCSKISLGLAYLTNLGTAMRLGSRWPKICFYRATFEPYVKPSNDDYCPVFNNALVLFKHRLEGLVADVHICFALH